MSNPINIITESIDEINNNLDLIESKEQSVDNVKEQICNICSYNKILNQSYIMLYYATIVQPELAPVLAATKSLSKILGHFCNACVDYKNNKTGVLDKLKPYISQLREGLFTVQELINENKKYIDNAYEKTKSFSTNMFKPTPDAQPAAAAAGGYKRRQSKRKQNRLSKRKSIKKKSKKNRRR